MKIAKNFPVLPKVNESFMDWIILTTEIPKGKVAISE